MKLSTILASMFAATATAAPIARCIVHGEAVDCDALTKVLAAAVEDFMESHATLTESPEIVESYPCDWDQGTEPENYSEEEFPPPRFVNSHQLDNSQTLREPDVKHPDNFLEQFELKN